MHGQHGAGAAEVVSQESLFASRRVDASTGPLDSRSVARPYRSSKWHHRQRKIIFELFMHFIADTDTDENYFEINFS